MILLTATTNTLELTTTAAVSCDYSVSFADITTAAFTPGSSDGNVATATTTTIVAAPAASTQRQIKLVSIRNRSTTTAQTVTVKKDVSATEYCLTPDVVLQPGEQLVYTDGSGWSVLDRNGAVKTVAREYTGVTGRTVAFYKTGTAAEAAGNYYGFSKDAGGPGAWSVGTSGLAGRATDGTTAGDVGCIAVPNAATGSNFLTELNASSTVACHLFLRDVLWVNNGIVVTTTTAQTINSVTLPARDQNGSTNGADVQIGLYFVAASTNAAVISGATISYTNSDGTASRTATLGTGVDGIPATPVIGTFVPFRLQAGDTGVRSIQTITLGTSLVTGTVSLMMFRTIKSVPLILANVGSAAQIPQNPGIRLYSGVCLLPFSQASATTLNIIAGTISVMER